MYWYFCASYNGFCVAMFVHVIQSNFWLYLYLLWMDYSTTASFLYLYFNSYVCDFHIYDYCDMFLYFILSLLGWATYWESFHAYSLYIICYSVVVILIDPYSQKCINISLFELVVTGIETHIFVPNLSISHVFISIIKFSIVSYF